MLHCPQRPLPAGALRVGRWPARKLAQKGLGGRASSRTESETALIRCDESECDPRISPERTFIRHNNRVILQSLLLPVEKTATSRNKLWRPNKEQAWLRGQTDTPICLSVRDSKLIRLNASPNFTLNTYVLFASKSSLTLNVIAFTAKNVPFRVVIVS